MSMRQKPKAPPARDPGLRLAAEAKLSLSRGTALKPQRKTPVEIIHAVGWGALIYNLGQLSASRWLELIPHTAAGGGLEG